jgi:hypothetical protein
MFFLYPRYRWEYLPFGWPYCTVQCDTCSTHTTFVCNTHSHVYKAAGDILGRYCVYLCRIRDNADKSELYHTHGRCCMNTACNWRIFFQLIAHWPAQLRSPMPDPWHVMCESCIVYSYLCNPAAWVHFCGITFCVEPVIGHTGMILLQLSCCVPCMWLNHVTFLSIMIVIIIIIVVVVILLLYSPCRIYRPF